LQECSLNTEGGIEGEVGGEREGWEREGGERGREGEEGEREHSDTLHT